MYICSMGIWVYTSPVSLAVISDRNDVAACGIINTSIPLMLLLLLSALANSNGHCFLLMIYVCMYSTARPPCESRNDL
jgi:hypothetical protein